MTLTKPAIVTAMRQQAESSRQATRLLPSGLILKLAQAGNTYTLTLARRHPGPGERERAAWREAFRVPGEVFEYKAVEDDYIFVEWEWCEPSSLPPRPG